MATPRRMTVVIPLGNKELPQDFSFYRDRAKEHGVEVTNFQAVPRETNRFYPGQCTLSLYGFECDCWDFARYLAWHHVWQTLQDEDAAATFLEYLTTFGPSRWYLRQRGTEDRAMRGPFENPHAAAEWFVEHGGL